MKKEQVREVGSADKILHCENDLNLLDSQMKMVSRSVKFRRVWEKGSITRPGHNRQLFYRENRPAYEASLMELGYGLDGAEKGTKNYLISEMSSILSELVEIDTYRILNARSGKVALRTKDSDYELSVIAHRGAQFIPKEEIELIGNLRPHTIEIADKLTERGFDIFRVKNNLITMKDEEDEDEQMSIRLTRKRDRLF